MAKASSMTVDFTKVKDGGNFNKKRIPAGDYLAKITKVQDAKAKGDDQFQYLFTIQVAQFPTTAYPYYCKLVENQLWKLRNLLIAAGISVPKKKIKVEPSKIVGRTIGVTVEDDEYDGKEQSVIQAVFPASELSEGQLEAGDDDADDEEDEEEEDDDSTGVADDEPDTDEFDEMDRTALKAYLVSVDSDFKAKKSQSDDDLRELARAVPEEDAVDLSDADEEEEPEPKPKKKAKAEPEPAPKKAKKKKAAVTDDELEELDISDI